ncbi:MAG: hypothetical protein A3C46_03195 [Deltaproteobacteria bacterium RIFCSPHIGHO2_02_FULL_44_16]|nr:MAG: hypothetical protein A3C46_03195 [Deltaproteobacteria bacterium RIFCSPHIGHO2_02_FULL_44_16]
MHSKKYNKDQTLLSALPPAMTLLRTRLAMDPPHSPIKIMGAEVFTASSPQWVPIASGNADFRV